MKYTKQQLITQKTLAEQQLVAAKEAWKYATSTVFKPAIEYGEDVRVNHLRTINHRMTHWSKKVKELEFMIEDMEDCVTTDG